MQAAKVPLILLAVPPHLSPSRVCYFSLGIQKEPNRDMWCEQWTPRRSVLQQISCNRVAPTGDMVHALIGNYPHVRRKASVAQQAELPHGLAAGPMHSQLYLKLI